MASHSGYPFTFYLYVPDSNNNCNDFAFNHEINAKKSLERRRKK